MRIAALEDDRPQSEALARLIVGWGHTCQTFSSAKALIATLRRESFDLLIVDWNLPGMSGLEAIAWAQQNLSEAPPILLLTSRSTEADIVEGLNAGADDYVAKPFEPSVLQARLSALLRRATFNRRSEPIETFEEFEFDSPSEILRVAGREIDLSPKEFSLARLLFRNLHRTLSRAYILEAVWGRSPDLATRTIDMHVSRIRTKLALRPENGFRLAPVYSYGYRLERFGRTDAAAEASSSGMP